LKSAVQPVGRKTEFFITKIILFNFTAEIVESEEKLKK